MKLKTLSPWKKSYDQPRQHIKKQRLLSQQRFVYLKLCFFQCHAWMWVLDHKEGWGPENWCFWTMVLEKTLENPLDCKEIKPVNPKGNQSWIFIGMTDAETPILWPPDAKCWPTGKTLMLGKVEGRKRRGWQKISLLDGIIDSMDISLNKLWRWWRTGKPHMLQSMGL